MKLTDIPAALEGISAELRQAADAITVAPGTALFDRLWDRDQALDEAVSLPSRYLRRVTLDCGCEFRCDGYFGGYPINPQWTVTCLEHSA